MKNAVFYIDQAAKGFAPGKWYLKDNVNFQRFFYIKTGRGYMLDDSGNKSPFKPGNLYLFPYNVVQRFENDPDDPINHIYFDFLSTPPIVAPEPIVYGVSEESALQDLIKAIDRILPTRKDSWESDAPSKNIGQIPDADSGSVDEYRQIVYSLFSATLTILSSIKEVPFSSDALINSALETIRERYMEPLTIADLASDAGFEVNHFIRRFRRIMGVTPYSYLRSFRLMKARGLVGSGMTLTEISELVGYENASSLSRALSDKHNI